MEVGNCWVCALMSTADESLVLYKHVSCVPLTELEQFLDILFTTRRKYLCQQRSEEARQEIWLVLDLPFNDSLCLHSNEVITPLYGSFSFWWIVFGKIWCSWTTCFMILKKRIVSKNALSSGREVYLELSCVALYWVAWGATETSSLQVFFSLVLCSRKLYICQYCSCKCLVYFFSGTSLDIYSH